MGPNKNNCTTEDSSPLTNHYRSCSGAHSRTEGRKEYAQADRIC